MAGMTASEPFPLHFAFGAKGSSFPQPRGSAAGHDGRTAASSEGFAHNKISQRPNTARSDPRPDLYRPLFAGLSRIYAR